MSKIGRKPILLPKGVTVVIKDDKVKVQGPKGLLEHDLLPNINVEVKDGVVEVKRENDKKQTMAFHGLMRAKINNMIIGVTQGFTKELELVGVGYRADLQGNVLNFTLGYSHPVKFELPKNVSCSVEKQTKIVLTSIDKELLGQTAANIMKLRLPDAYKGKGIRIAGTVLKLKPGKAAAKK
jgi:large subunit ribosomal protein L6